MKALWFRIRDWYANKLFDIGSWFEERKKLVPGIVTAIPLSTTSTCKPFFPTLKGLSAILFMLVEPVAD